MSVLKPEQRKELIERQGGVSPISGRKLDKEKQRLETHHVIERRNGGRSDLDNLQMLPREEHLLAHYLNFCNQGGNRKEQELDLDVVWGRIDELTKEEKIKFYELLEEKTGKRPRFI